MALFSWQGMALSRELEFSTHGSPHLEQTGLLGFSQAWQTWGSDAGCWTRRIQGPFIPWDSQTQRDHRKADLLSFRLSPHYPTKGIHSPFQPASLFSRSYHSRLSILLLAVVNIYKVLTTCWAPCQGHTYFISLNPFNKVTKGAIIIFSLHLRLREVRNSMNVPWVVTEEGPRDRCLLTLESTAGWRTAALSQHCYPGSGKTLDLIYNYHSTINLLCDLEPIPNLFGPQFS